MTNTEYGIFPEKYEGMGIFTSGKLRNTEFFWLKYSASTPIYLHEPNLKESC